jgi:hypothetical protein
VCLVLFLSPAVLYIFPLAAKRKKKDKKAQEESESHPLDA